MSLAGYNCEIVYNHEKYLLLRLLPVQHLFHFFDLAGKKKLLNVKRKIFLIEFVEVPLEFNIIF